MERIASFTVNHDTLRPGLYLSRRDGNVTTFDLRFKRPNTGDLLTNAQMHSVEHVIATLLRNSAHKDAVIYFGPMGCRTGFYLLVRDLAPEEVLTAVKEALAAVVAHDGEMFGGTRKECGNYRELSLASAKAECGAFLAVLESHEQNFIYPTK